MTMTTMTIRYEDADRCTDCGHMPGCPCPHFCTPAGPVIAETAQRVIARLLATPRANVLAAIREGR